MLQITWVICSCVLIFIILIRIPQKDGSTQNFNLSSGFHSPKYVQCAKLMSNPAKAKEICISLSEKILKESYNSNMHTWESLCCNGRRPS